MHRSRGLILLSHTVHRRIFSGVSSATRIFYRLATGIVIPPVPGDVRRSFSAHAGDVHAAFGGGLGSHRNSRPRKKRRYTIQVRLLCYRSGQEAGPTLAAGRCKIFRCAGRRSLHAVDVMPGRGGGTTYDMCTSSCAGCTNRCVCYACCICGQTLSLVKTFGRTAVRGHMTKVHESSLGGRGGDLTHSSQHRSRRTETAARFHFAKFSGGIHLCDTR